MRKAPGICGAAAHGEATELHQPTYNGLEPRSLPRYRSRPVSLRDHMLGTGQGQGRILTWRKGSKAAMSSPFVLVPSALPDVGSNPPRTARSV